VGKKWKEGDSARSADGLLNVEAIVAQTNRLLALGCEHVYLESRVLREAIGDYGEKQSGTEQVRQIMDAVGQDKIFIEISGQLPFDTRQCHRFWAVRNFGPEVNIGGGGSIDEVRHIESIRRGFAFVNSPGKSTTKLWVKSLATNHGKAASEWWKQEYPLDRASTAADKK
jgi:phosphosulfolactate synthase (CoM biosynthesis protein A)